jgi:hypothetical protein
MKNKLLHFFLFAFLFGGCQKDLEINSTGKIAFELASKKLSDDGRVSDSIVPSSILITIETSTGVSFLNNKKIFIYPFGSGYISESIELPIGNYKLTKFIVLNSHDESILAAPVAGSVLAALVSNPLPISFSITGNSSTQVVPEVLPVSSTNDPVQFGYTVFGFNVKKRIHSKTFFEFDSAKNDLVESWKDVYKFEGTLLKEVNSFVIDHNLNILWSRKFFEYNEKNQLTIIKFQPQANANYFHVKQFDHSASETKITMFEMTDKWKSVEYYTTRKISSTYVQLVDDYRTIDYTIMNSNLVNLKLSDRPFITKMEYDTHTNPEYFIDAISELTYANTEIGSKNNLIKSTVVENGVEKTILTVSITYDADGYPATRVYEYVTGEKFKYSYTYQ